MQHQKIGGKVGCCTHGASTSALGAWWPATSLYVAVQLTLLATVVGSMLQAVLAAQHLLHIIELLAC